MFCSADSVGWAASKLVFVFFFHFVAEGRTFFLTSQPDHQKTMCFWRFVHLGPSTKPADKKKCAPLRRKCTCFCLPVFLLATNSRTFKNTLFFDDSAGLSKRMCAGLRRNDRKKRKSFLRRPSLHNQRSETSKNQWFFLIFLTKSLVIPYQSPGGAEKYTCPLKRKDLAVTFFSRAAWPFYWQPLALRVAQARCQQRPSLSHMDPNLQITDF